MRLVTTKRERKWLKMAQSADLMQWKSIYLLLKNRKWSPIEPETYDIVLTYSLNNHRGMLDLENSL